MLRFDLQKPAAVLTIPHEGEIWKMASSMPPKGRQWLPQFLLSWVRDFFCGNIL